jgi:rod shape determining protein RodA
MPSYGYGGLAERRSIASRWHIDVPLLLLLMSLTVFGLVVLYSASGRSMEMVERQGMYFLIGYGVMLVLAQVRVDIMCRLSPWLYCCGIVLLVLVLVMGVGAKGARRWLDFPGLPRFQPSELVKLFVPMTVSWYLGSRTLPPRFKYVLISCALVFVPAALIMKQPDLGTSLLVISAGLFALLLAGLQWRYIVGAGVLGVSAIPVAWMYLLHDYQKRRVLTLLNPESDKLGAGWNIIQSKTAIGSGGLHGKGWLEGTQSHLEFLPESHTDFIIAVLGEEFGLIGVLALLSIYVLIIVRGLMIGMNAQDMFSRLLAGSITLTFFVYVFVNMGMVSGILPVVGVPLPMVSYGGTAIVTLFAGFGLLMAIATARRRLTGL